MGKKERNWYTLAMIVRLSVGKFAVNNVCVSRLLSLPTVPLNTQTHTHTRIESKHRIFAGKQCPRSLKW